jgi:hypothetical protein
LNKITYSEWKSKKYLIKIIIKFEKTMNLERFDDFYFTICKETGGIEGLLHSFF